jgi:hypothetical protein
MSESVLRTFRRQRLFKCNFKRSLNQYNGDKIPVRGLKNSALDCQFRILFMGRDIFSCTVLEELFKARGRYVCMKVEVYKKLFFYLRLIKLVDVWEEIIIATQPDMYVGRRKSVLSVCKLDSSLGIKKSLYEPQLHSESLARS